MPINLMILLVYTQHATAQRAARLDRWCVFQKCCPYSGLIVKNRRGAIPMYYNLSNNIIFSQVIVGKRTAGIQQVHTCINSSNTYDTDGIYIYDI